MKAEIRILVEYDSDYDRVLISSRGVDGDGLPLDVYIGILNALRRMQREYNEKTLETTIFLPSEISFAPQPGSPAHQAKVTALEEERKNLAKVPEHIVKEYESVDKEVSTPPHAENSSNS